MKKIPTLFKREFENHKVVKCTDIVTPGLEWVLAGEGTATIKMDGSCCAVIDGELYKRYDCKKGKTPPEGAIPCGEADPVTGHWPHWVKCDRNKPEDRWFFEAYENEMEFLGCSVADGTYEAIGEKFQGNPYHLERNVLYRHGMDPIGELNTGEPRTAAQIHAWLAGHKEEGIVFWKDGEPQCKIKRTDYGLSWPIVKKEEE